MGYVNFWQSWLRRFPQPVVDEAFRLLQRVEIARALLQNPDLLLVDEPTASLDPKTARQIMHLITELAQERGLAVIINIHDVQLAQLFAQRIVGWREGKIVYDGPPDGLTPAVLTEIVSGVICQQLQ